MTLFDVVRVVAFAGFGGGMGFAILTNTIAFKVLRPPKQLGFLWWHVTSITCAFLLIGIVATERVVGRLGSPPGWRSVLVCVGMTLFFIAQVIIFKVERQRLVNKRAMEQVAGTT